MSCVSIIHMLLDCKRSSNDLQFERSHTQFKLVYLISQAETISHSVLPTNLRVKCSHMAPLLDVSITGKELQNENCPQEEKTFLNLTHRAK